MSNYTAIIIEPRKHKALEFVLDNFLCNLSNEWSIVVFHGNLNIEYVKNIVDKLNKIYDNRIIKLINLHIDDLNYQTYSNLFLTKSFYRYIPTNVFMVFQTDSIILHENKDNINLFLEYDYVGAPWSMKGKLHNLVGNGGLSIRNKTKMIEILINKKNKKIKDDIEDVYFSTDIDSKIQYHVPDYTKAKLFSVETMFYESPFGIHNCWKYLNKEHMHFLVNKYSDIQTLMKLQEVEK
jgi:hypothetical protein